MISTRSKFIGAVFLAIVGLLAYLSTNTTKQDESLEKTPSSNYFIPTDEMPKVLAAANHKDIDAIRKLIDHWGGYAGNLDQAEVWKQKAREAGDEFELRLYARKLLNQAREPGKDRNARRALLENALATAERASTVKKSASTSRIIVEIREELKKLD
jgi:hypothetical protein